MREPERPTQGSILLAVGGTAVWLGRSDVTLSYVRAGIRPLLLASGAVLVALGLAAFRGPVARAPEGHAHGGVGPRIGWLLALPPLVLILVAPPALGSYAAGQRAVPVADWVGQGAPRFPPLQRAVAGAVPMDLSEFFYRARFDPNRSLAGARVRLLGFVTHHRVGGAYVLARFQMFCCAADAEIVEVAVRGDPTPRAAEQWLLVEGRWQPPPGQRAAPGTVDVLPVLLADAVRPVAPPRDRYEHSLLGW
ncbi:MAG TPA: TIGR03943 family protein [Actinomycetes bacterium]